jgi:hypothetical protein
MPATLRLPKAAPSASRVNVVFIRKSTQAQDEGGQLANVGNMLRDVGVHVPERCWFVGTVGRRKVKSNAEFNRLMEMVENDQVGTVYVESQDRWGTADRGELFSLLKTLRDHSTKLYDLRAGKDLTEKDIANELLAIVNSIKSEKELQDISYRSLRTRVNNFKETGSWPTGPHPFGYGKECLTREGKSLWVWQPVSKARGQLFLRGPDGKLTPGRKDILIPRKGKEDRIKLVPSNNPEYVESVKLVFDLYTRVGLSRRKIAVKLNEEGRKFYSRPFSQAFVTGILRNPAYAGDTHFGKNRTGTLHTFDAKALVVELKGPQEKEKRDEAERIVKKDTHEALIERETWERAAKKLKSEQERRTFSPRNPAYYLKQLFVCGHCGKGLIGHSHIDPTTKAKTPGYKCITSANARASGEKVACGYHWISHKDAEQLLLDKMKRMGLEYDETQSEPARANIKTRLANLGREGDDDFRKWNKWIEDGMRALIEHFRQTLGPDDSALKKISALADCFYRGLDLDLVAWKSKLPMTRAAFLEAVQEAEAKSVNAAKEKVAALKADHGRYTKKWVEASDLMQGVMKQELDRMEAEIREWEPHTVPLRERLNSLHEAEQVRDGERNKLLAEWPTLEAREKGEALRRLFGTVTLFWKKWFQPAAKKPTRVRKTNRPGRYRYTLERDQTKWTFATTDLKSPW